MNCKTFILRVLLLFIALLLVDLPSVVAQKLTSDTLVERLMNQFKYKDATTTIKTILKDGKEITLDNRLYYNNRLSMAYLRMRMIDSAMICARQSLKLAKNSKDSTLIADGWKMASYSYNNIGKLDSAEYYTTLFLNYAIRFGDERLVRNAKTSLATILAQNKKYKEALQYHKESFELTKKIKDTLSYSINLYNVGLSFLNVKQYDSCLVYLQQAADLAKREKHNEVLIYSYGTMADCYLAQKNINEWEKYLQLARGIAEDIKNYQLMAMGYSNLLQGLTQQKNYSEAIRSGHKALEFLREHPYPVLQMEVDSAMYVANKASGNFAKAIEFYESYVNEKSLILNEKQKLQLSEIQTRLQVQEKDLLINQQNILLLKRQRSAMLATWISIILMLIIVAILVQKVINRRNRKELYKKEKDLDDQLSETRQWLEGIAMRESGISDVFSQLPYEGEFQQKNKEVISPQSLLYAELREVIENQKLYLNPDLNLQEVIKLLGTNKKYLYQAISSSSDDNFSGFINRYRVNHAKQLIQEGVRQQKVINITELFSVSGFNNPTSFFRTFKTMTGLTPKEYTVEVENDYRSNKI